MAEKIEQLYNYFYKSKKSKKIQEIIYDIRLKEKWDFYGYKKKKELFLKILVYNPRSIRNIGSIFQHGLILEKKFRCYEIHIDYDIKFIKDCDISGFKKMTFMNYYENPVNLIFNNILDKIYCVENPENFHNNDISSNKSRIKTSLNLKNKYINEKLNFTKKNYSENHINFDKTNNTTSKNSKTKNFDNNLKFLNSNFFLENDKNENIQNLITFNNQENNFFFNKGKRTSSSTRKSIHKMNYIDIIKFFYK